MKRISLLLLSVALTAFVWTPASTFAQSAAKKSKKETVKLFIKSMDCQNCVKKIEKNIAFEKGVTDLKCDLKTQTVEVTYRSDKTTVDKLLKAFEKIDEPAKVVKPDEKAKPKHDHKDHKGHEGHKH